MRLLGELGETFLVVVCPNRLEAVGAKIHNCHFPDGADLTRAWLGFFLPLAEKSLVDLISSIAQQLIETWRPLPDDLNPPNDNPMK